MKAIWDSTLDGNSGEALIDVETWLVVDDNFFQSVW